MSVDLEKLKGLSMPRFAWTYERCTEPAHWLLMARAYMESSHCLFGAMIEGRAKGSFHHAKVAASLLIHSVELFLKGGICLAGKKVPTIHFLKQLHGKFNKLFPGKSFEFTGSIAELAEQSSETPHNEFTRYPTDKSGSLWGSNSNIDLVIWFHQASRFLEDFERLEPLMKQRYKEIAKK